jgi:alpha-L-rhamnosidase
MMARQRRRVSSSHRAGPPNNPRRRRLRAAAAGVFSLALGVLTLTGATTASALPSQQAAQSGSATPTIGSLTTNQTTNPLGIDDSHPQLGWVITSAARGVSQSQYEIRVSADESGLVSGRNLVWDSGTVKSTQSFDVAYGGKALASQTRYYWQVRVRDNDGRLSPWSQPAWFETAFLDPSQFQGSWVTSPTPAGGSELLLRKDFTLASQAKGRTGSQDITRARLYVAGLSYPYLYVNGHAVTNSVLNTAFTTYDKTVDYSTYDVTRLVRPGSDALAVSLGNGFYAGGADDYPASGESWQPGEPTLKLELDVWYANGTSAQVVSDGSWKVTTGPTTANSPAAEAYDARLAKPGWTQPSYEDSGWGDAAVLPAASTIPSYSGTPTADWLWNTAGAATTTTAGTIYLRKTFTVTDPSTISSAVLRVNGDDGEMTYVNGTLVATSPANVINGWQTSQVADIKSLLVAGTNVIAIAGLNSSGDASGIIAAVQLNTGQINTAQLDATRIVSDGTWKALPGTPASPPDGWNTASFDDSAWPAATVLGGYGTSPWGTGVHGPVTAPAGVLRADLIPPVERTATVKPVKVTAQPGVTVPVPSYSGSPTADWLWNTAGAAGAAPAGTIYLRKTFTVTDPSTISSAVLRVNGDDGEIAFVNGTQVTSSPGNADNAWQISQVADIKSLLVAGTNVIAIEGLNVQANASGVIAAVQLNTAQLGATRIVSDGTWKALPGTPASPPDGWNTASFDDSAWPAANVLGGYGTSPWGTGVANPAGPSKVYDFGITTSGWARITLQGTAGTQVQIEYSEKLNPDGTAQGEGSQTDTYILNGGGPETYEPKYGWKGYRYVEVTTSPATAGGTAPPLPDILSVTGVVAHTALATSGNFSSSSTLLNEMHTAMANTILNNQYSYGSDTPVYEKGGWTNDNGDYSDSEMANFAAEAYYDHMMQNFDDSQDPAGNIGWLVPTQPGGDNVDPLWGGSFLLIEYNMYQNYDDLAAIRRDYSHLAAYVDDLGSQIAPSGYIYQGTTFGDWVQPSNANPPSSEMLGSMFLYRETEDLAIMATAIGNTAGASKYDSLAASIRTAVNNEFYDAAGHEYRDPLGLDSHALGGPNGTITSTAYDQTANVYGLAFGLAPDGDQQAIAAGLAANVTAQGNHLATGANGSKYILPMLTDYGYGDLAYLVATNPTAPGWGQWFLQCGATTMWEAWEDSSCGSARSRDHAFMGTVDDWLFSGVAGISATSPGFRTVAIDPSPVAGLTHASGYEATPLGRVSSAWERSGTRLALTVQVPVGSQASVCVPAATAKSVTEGGVPVGSARGVTVTGMQGSCLQVRVGSGTYLFRSTVS